MTLEDRINEMLLEKNHKRENDTTRFFDRMCEKVASSISEYDLTNEIVRQDIYFKSYENPELIDITLLHRLAEKKHMDLEVYTTHVRVELKLYEIKAMRLRKK